MNATPVSTTLRQPRAQRNRNPGNLRPLGGGQAWQGETGRDDSPGGPFVVFETVPHGFRAMVITLNTYQRRHGLLTVDSMMRRWAPLIENDTGAYANAVARAMGVHARVPIDLSRDAAPMVRMVEAMALHEAGRRWWQREDLAQGLAMTLLYTVPAILRAVPGVAAGAIGPRVG